MKTFEQPKLEKSTHLLSQTFVGDKYSKMPSLPTLPNDTLPTLPKDTLPTLPKDTNSSPSKMNDSELQKTTRRSTDISFSSEGSTLSQASLKNKISKHISSSTPFNKTSSSFSKKNSFEVRVKSNHSTDISSSSEESSLSQTSLGNKISAYIASTTPFNKTSPSSSKKNAFEVRKTTNLSNNISSSSEGSIQSKTSLSNKISKNIPTPLDKTSPDRSKRNSFEVGVKSSHSTDISSSEEEEESSLSQTSMGSKSLEKTSLKVPPEEYSLASKKNGLGNQTESSHSICFSSNSEESTEDDQTSSSSEGDSSSESSHSYRENFIKLYEEILSEMPTNISRSQCIDEKLKNGKEEGVIGKKESFVEINLVNEIQLKERLCCHSKEQASQSNLLKEGLIKILENQMSLAKESTSKRLVFDGSPRKDKVLNNLEKKESFIKILSKEGKSSKPHGSKCEERQAEQSNFEKTEDSTKSRECVKELLSDSNKPNSTSTVPSRRPLTKQLPPKMKRNVFRKPLARGERFQVKGLSLRVPDKPTKVALMGTASEPSHAPFSHSRTGSIKEFLGKSEIISLKKKEGSLQTKTEESVASSSFGLSSLNSSNSCKPICECRPKLDLLGLGSASASKKQMAESQSNNVKKEGMTPKENEMVVTIQSQYQTLSEKAEKEALLQGNVDETSKQKTPSKLSKDPYTKLENERKSKICSEKNPSCLPFPTKESYCLPKHNIHFEKRRLLKMHRKKENHLKEGKEPSKKKHPRETEANKWKGEKECDYQSKRLEKRNKKVKKAELSEREKNDEEKRWEIQQGESSTYNSGSAITAEENRNNNLIYEGSRYMRFPYLNQDLDVYCQDTNETYMMNIMLNMLKSGLDMHVDMEMYRKQVASRSKKSSLNIEHRLVNSKTNFWRYDGSINVDRLMRKLRVTDKVGVPYVAIKERDAFEEQRRLERDIIGKLEKRKKTKL